MEPEGGMVGQRILGRFTIEGRLGSGGFGTVYRAWDQRLRRAVAVKVIERPGQGSRVSREAQASARLAHRNIATLYELAGDEDRAYLVGELVEGSSLRALAGRGQLSDRAVAQIGEGAAAGLAHAHRQGVVHRDVKPDNILVPEQGPEAKLVDFGIARIAGERTLTATGAVMGTIAYMAPEQADGLRPGPAADVYSLAITLYECWTGEHPLAAGGPAATARAIGEQISPLKGIRPDLPGELTSLIDACLDPDPDRRPLGSELERALHEHGPGLSGEPLPPLATELDEPEPPRLLSQLTLAGKVASAAGLAAGTLAALLLTRAPPPVFLTLVALTAALALVRPRVALALAAGGIASWAAIGAGEPGAGLLVLFLALPLLAAPLAAARTLPLPAIAPLLGAAGLAGAYPVLAGMPRRAADRVLLGATGYLWLVSAEIVAGRDLFLGPQPAATTGWEGSVSASLSEVIGPLLSVPVLLGALVWGLAALTFPIFVRGSFGALDLLGGILWAAALVSAERLLAGPGGAPDGLLVVVVIAAALSAWVANRLRAHRAGSSDAPGLHRPFAGGEGA